MNTTNRLFYRGTGLIFALSLGLLAPTIHCNSDSNNNNNNHHDMATGGGGDGGTGGGGDGGTGGGDGGSQTGVTLTSASPSKGPTTGKDPLNMANPFLVAINGTNLPADAQVYIDGQLATRTGAITSSQITVELPVKMAPIVKGPVLVEIRRPNIGTVAMSSTIFGYYFGMPKCDLPVQAPVGNGPTAIALTDLNSDGKLDAVVTNTLGNSVSALTWDTVNNKFVAATAITVDTKPSDIAVGFFDANTSPDVAVVNLSSNTVSILLNSGGTLGSPMVYKTNLVTNAAPQGITVGKFTADAFSDVATANGGTAGSGTMMGSTISLLTGTGAAGSNYLNTTALLGADTSATSVPIAIANADMDGDGKLDLVVVNNFHSNVGVLIGDGLGNFTLKNNYSTGAAQPRALAIGDFNGDGAPDVAVTLSNTTPTLGILYGDNRAGHRGELIPVTTTTSMPGTADADTPYGIAAGDLNGDGLSDLVVALNGSTKVVLMMAQQGGFGTPLLCASGSAPRGVAIGDINGDGNLDIAVTNQSGNEVVSILNKFQ